MKTKSNPSFRTWAGRSVLLRSLIIGLCGTAFTACNREETMTLNEENGEASVLQIGANVAQLTKATDGGFELKDTLGLYAVKWLDASTPDTLRPTANHADNVWFRLESNVENWKPEHTVYFPADNNKIDLYAYYPYRTPAFGNGTQINLNVATNQTDSADYTRSDFMAAKTPGVKRTPNKVLLSFEHKLSQITIELKPGRGFSFADLKNAEVKIVNAITDATYDLAAMNTTPTVEDPEHRTVPVAGTTRADVTPHGAWYQKGDTTLAGKMAILVPQTLGANTYIQVTMGSRKFNFKPQDVHLNSGCSRRFTLTLSNTGLDITTVIIPWKNCGAVAGEAEEEFEMDTIVTMTTAKATVSFKIEANSDIIVDWGDGTKEKNMFSHTYTDGLEHIIQFYGEKTALQALFCYENQLTTLDIRGNAALTEINCTDNLLTTLNINENRKLTYLACNNNSLSSLDLSKNTALTTLVCFNNRLTVLNVYENTLLTEINCSDNQLTTLNIKNNTALTDFHCSNNPLNTLDITKNTMLRILTCFDTQLAVLDISKNIKINYLECYNSHLTTLNTDNNHNLIILSCYNNQLKTLNISNNIKLTDLYCSDNKITLLSISKNTNLINLTCDNNQLDSLNVSKCTALKTLDCSNNPFITDNTQMTACANSLPDRTGKESGTLQIKDPTAAAQIKSITDAKNWGVE